MVLSLSSPLSLSWRSTFVHSLTWKLLIGAKMLGKVFIPFHIASLVKEKASYKRPQKHVHMHVVTNFKLCQNKKLSWSRVIYICYFGLWKRLIKSKDTIFKKLAPGKGSLINNVYSTRNERQVLLNFTNVGFEMPCPSLQL